MKYKKWTVPIILLTLMLSFYTFSHADQDGRSWSDLPSNNSLKHEELFKNNELLQHLFLYPQTSFDEKEALQIVKTIYKLPPFLLSKLVEKDVRIKLFTGKLTDNASAAHLKGIKPRGYGQDATWDDVPGMGGSHTVLVKIGASDKGHGHGSVNLELHEVAHSIDQIVYGKIKDDPEFLTIWKKEVDSLFPNQSYFIHYPEEYFAESFAMYYVNQEQKYRLKRLAPLTYTYIKQLN